MTPFGTLESDEGKTKAPTLAEIAADPGRWSGTNMDPVYTFVPAVVLNVFSLEESGFQGPYEWWALYRHAPKEALLYFQMRFGGQMLNLLKLSPSQEILLGLRK